MKEETNTPEKYWHYHATLTRLSQAPMERTAKQDIANLVSEQKGITVDTKFSLDGMGLEIDANIRDPQEFGRVLYSAGYSVRDSKIKRL